MPTNEHRVIIIGTSHADCLEKSSPFRVRDVVFTEFKEKSITLLFKTKEDADSVRRELRR